MTFLHLADLHLGKRLRDISLIEDQAYILNEILALADGADGVLVCGDVYDKSVPSLEAVSLFDSFLTSLAEKGKPVFLIPGNHDGAGRLSFASDLLKKSGVYLAKSYEGALECVPLEKDGVKVKLYLLPFFRPAEVRRFDETVTDYTSAVQSAIAGVEKEEGVYNVLLAHHFVTGAAESGSEEWVGGVAGVDGGVFSAFDYVALGHIHRRQFLFGKRLHYPGTPLKYSLSEAEEARKATLVHFTKEGISFTEKTLVPLREMRKVRGTFADLMQGESDDFLFVTLLDEEEIPFAANRLAERYPNLLEVRRERKREEGDLLSSGFGEETPFELFERLYKKQSGAALTPEQEAYLKAALEEVFTDSN